MIITHGIKCVCPALPQDYKLFYHTCTQTSFFILDVRVRAPLITTLKSEVIKIWSTFQILLMHLLTSCVTLILH